MAEAEQSKAKRPNAGGRMKGTPKTGGRTKGAAKTGGRKKGTPNKVTADLKGMILGALEDAGGQNYLLVQSEENARSFLTLVGKVLPMKIGGEADHPVVIEVRRTIVPRRS